MANASKKARMYLTKLSAADAIQSLLGMAMPIPESGCWIWERWTTPRRYGQIGYHGKLYRAHRLMYQLTHGEIPMGLNVCHRCDVPECINPTHLFLGTQSENIRDCVAKGRYGNRYVSSVGHPKYMRVQ